ncbi:MAG: hypothetical protein H0T47_22700 [Planctomycetaceae bacterium]|nr:hypothetical protein [Planctomycetaceae bacterium]
MPENKAVAAEKTPFETFRDLAEKVVTTPKEAVDRHREELEREKRSRKPA